LRQTPIEESNVVVHPVFEDMSEVDRARRALSVSVSTDGQRRVIHLSGELDFASRDVVHGACVVDDSRVVAVDLDRLTFLDCSGYSGLIAARLELRSRGGSLTWNRPTGQPARFLAALEALERPVVKRVRSA
jgi:anti-anti-sigma factor